MTEKVAILLALPQDGHLLLPVPMELVAEAGGLDFWAWVLLGDVRDIPLGDKRRFPLPSYQLGTINRIICEKHRNKLPLNPLAQTIANISNGLNAHDEPSGSLSVYGDAIISYNEHQEPFPHSELQAWFGNATLEVDESTGASRVRNADGSIFISDDRPNLNALRSLEAGDDE